MSTIEDGKKLFDLIKSLQTCNHVIVIPPAPQKNPKHIIKFPIQCYAENTT